MALQYTCVDPAAFLYPDVTEYPGGTDRMTILSPRNSYACGQILIYNVQADTLSVEADGWHPEIYQMVAIPVERNEGMNENNTRPHQPERVAPFEVFDCLKPVRDGKVRVKNGVCALYFSERIEKDAPAEVRNASVRIGDTVVPVTVTTAKAVVPDETLTVIMGYYNGFFRQFHHAEPGSDEFKRLDDLYLKTLRRSHQNMLYCPGPEVKKEENGEWTVSFSNMERYFTRMTAYGFRRFNWGLGFRRSWSASEILVFGMPSMSLDCYCLLAKMLPALESFLREHGWLDMFTLGISDEPNECNATEYRALCGMVRKLAPSLVLLDAMSYGPVHGAVDIWIPLNSEYQRHREEFEVYRKNGDVMWYYDCCGPRGNGYINRFMDYPLLATRYHFWASYLYRLPGYLHWAAVCYQPGQNPFLQSCPEHHNADSVGFLPPGDTHLLYPGEGEPWMSVRLENQRASAEEYEMLEALAKKDKRLADEICQSVCRAFDDVEYDVSRFRAARNRLIEALSAIR